MADLPGIEPETTVGVNAVGEEFIVDAATDEVLRLHLDKFEGPFEVLLYLIKSQEIDIFDIPIVTITEQYLRFLDLMEDESLEVTGEFLVLAATLIQIKSRMLLPADEDTEEEEDLEDEDPRLELVEKLLEYRRYQHVMDFLRDMEEARERIFARNAKVKLDTLPEDDEELLEVSLYDLMRAFKRVLRYLTDDIVQTIEGEGASVDDKIDDILARLEEEQSISWLDLFRNCKSRVELVCCFLAILELCRMDKVRAHQHATFGDIRLFAKEPAPGYRPDAYAEPEWDDAPQDDAPQDDDEESSVSVDTGAAVESGSD